MPFSWDICISRNTDAVDFALARASDRASLEELWGLLSDKVTMTVSWVTKPTMAQPLRRGISEDPGRDQLCTVCLLGPDCYTWETSHHPCIDFWPDPCFALHTYFFVCYWSHPHCFLMAWTSFLFLTSLSFSTPRSVTMGWDLNFKLVRWVTIHSPYTPYTSFH